MTAPQELRGHYTLDWVSSFPLLQVVELHPHLRLDDDHLPQKLELLVWLSLTWSVSDWPVPQMAAVAIP